MSCLDLAVVLGEKVERASATLPQTATQSLFTISGGRVLVTSLFGTITTTTGSVSSSVFANPTSTASSTTLIADGLGPSSVGFVVSYVGPGESNLSGVVVGVACKPTIIFEGTIDLQTSQSVAGEVSWTLTYVALDEGATVTAA